MRTILTPVIACLLAGQFAAPSLAGPPQPPFKPFDIQTPADFDSDENKDDEDKGGKK